jgi:diguanylate cyclase (GGDEF)-like protein
MSTLEQTVFQLKKGWRASSVYLFAGAYAALFVTGSFAGFWQNTMSRIGVTCLFAAWAAVFGVRAHRRFAATRTTKQRHRERDDLELGLLLVVGTYGAVQAAGGLSSLVYPIVFVLVAFLVVYTPQWVGFSLVGCAIVVEFSLAAFGPSAVSLHEVLVHAVFIVFFALINLVFTRTEVARMRRSAQKAVEEAKAAMADDARDFRLTAPAKGAGWAMSREEEAERLTQSSMRQVKVTMVHHVDLLKRTLKLNTCAVLWMDQSGENLRVRECLSDTENVITKSFFGGEGVPGAILKNRKPLTLKKLRPGYPGLTYYADPVPVTDFIGVPIVEGASLRGVLCGDRTCGKAFAEEDVETFEAAVESLLNTVANERVFNQLQKTKSEQAKLLLASEALSKHPGEKEVIQAALMAAHQIAQYDLGLVTLIGADGEHTVLEAVGKRSDELAGEKVSTKGSLAAAALKNRHYLPYRGDFDARVQILLSKKTQGTFARMRSVVVLPLISGETSIGTMILVCQQASVFDDEVRCTLQVMTNQLGTVLENAAMYQKLKELATTDGLTGLPNHRIFQEELDKKLASAARIGAKLSVIFCDVDKFKNVNDTFGHPVGDLVLKGLAKILKRDVVRDTDLAARYGGEEFAIICEGTDTDGAFKLAERIRKDLEKELFETDQGKLKVTISMGIATYPIHGKKKEELVERADTALYAAKEGGRNQVRTWTRELAA